MDVQLKRGLIEICVLAALLSGESYGYALIKDISNCIEISESTLYPILKRLESASLLDVSTREHNGRLRKYYSITPLGHTRIDDFVVEQSDILKVFKFIEEMKGEVSDDTN